MKLYTWAVWDNLGFLGYVDAFDEAGAKEAAANLWPLRFNIRVVKDAGFPE